MLRRIAVFAVLSLAAFAVPAVPASAASFTVNSTLDSPDANPADNVCATAAGQCTLRAAIQQANATPGTEVITVPEMTIPTDTALSISTSMTIRGAGARRTILSARMANHVMLSVTNGNVLVGDLTITGASNSTGALGVSQSNGALTLERVRVTDNIATGVGAVYGPVYIGAGSLSIIDSEISGNTTNSAGSSAYGGGLAVYNATVTVMGSTISGNSLSGATSGQGGGIWAGNNSSVTVTSSTIANNTIGGFSRLGAAAFQNSGGSGSIEVAQSVLAMPKGVTNCSGGGVLPVFAGANLLDDASCGPASPHRTIAAANLGDLSDNGGPTNSLVPQPGSPAIDAATACASGADQRGQARPIGAACDLGSLEVGSDREAAVSISNPSPPAGSDVVVTATVRNKGADRSTGTTMTITATGASQVVSASVPGGSCSISGQTATCALGVVPGGASTDVVLAVRMPTSGTVTVSAAVSGQQPDPVAGNNAATATATVPVAANARCAVTRTGTGKGDVLLGTAAGDRLLGKGGNDRISGKGGQDCLFGGPGKDWMSGGPEADTVSGGPGADLIRVKGGGKDRVNCGPGRDVVIADNSDKLARCEVVRR